MPDVVRNEFSRNVHWPFRSAATELALLSRQTRVLECIATQLGVLSARVGQAIETPVELQQDYQLAVRRLLMEAV